MKTRGRDSAASQAVVTADQLQEIPRPDAPYDLTDEQSGEWWAVVNRMPADWFPRETQPLLTQWCRLITRGRRVAQLANDMEKSEDFNLEVYERLLKTEQAISRALASLATRMRITQQSLTDERKQKKQTVKRPWE